MSKVLCLNKKRKQMFRRLSIIAFISIATVGLVHAQDFSVGFKAGLNFSSLSGPSEVDDSGAELENYKLTTGFLFGGRFNVKLTDQFGVRAELTYGQKGAEYSFDGQSYWVFPTEDASRVVRSTGNRSTVLKITNSYLELPLMAYARFGRVELSGGVSVAALISSRGTGELIYSGETSGGETVNPFTIVLDYNYFGDPLIRNGSDDVENRTLDGEIVEIPASIDAYYEASQNDTKFFNGLDLGLNAEIAFFLNQGLYIGLRGNYGLADVTKTEQDFSIVSLGNDNQVVLRDDKDRNISLLASLGFSF